MERESFEDEQIAEILNQNYVCIKVDREERPDIDNIYMAVCQQFTGRGGWPMSIFMDSDQRPFFAGTYFPKNSAYGMKGFSEILAALLELWKGNRAELIKSSEAVVQFLQDREDTLNDNDLAWDELIHQAYHLYAVNFDTRYGATKGAPKFPSPHTIYFLLRYATLNDDVKALQIAEKTLVSMFEGGIYDHIGFGFCRYSTDAKWLVPHFEKMLYDNALLLIAYTEAYQYTGKEIYRVVAEQIILFIQAEMTSPVHGFYTAIDADSEGVEGKFYLWSKQEIIDILGRADGEKFCRAYNITEHGNFEGKNIPNLIGKEHVHFPGIIKKLLIERDKRVKPYKDDKILTGQNGMMIAALAFCGRVFKNEEFVQMAENAVNFINEVLFTKEGRLLARYREGEAGILAYADDYVYMIWALIECYYATADEAYLKQANDLNDQLIELFWDAENGGLFLYGSDGEQLLKRPKDFYDGAVPSSNSVCAHNFVKLSRLTENPELENMARRIMTAFGDKSPMGVLHLISAAMHLEKSSDVKLVGTEATDGYKDMLRTLNGRFLPFTTVKFQKDEGEYKLLNDKATAYICKEFSCAPGTNDISFI